MQDYKNTQITVFRLMELQLYFRRMFQGSLFSSIQVTSQWRDYASINILPRLSYLMYLISWQTLLSNPPSFSVGLVPDNTPVSSSVSHTATTSPTFILSGCKFTGAQLHFLVKQCFNQLVRMTSVSVMKH